MRATLRTWLELTRLSNLPTVWSNTLTGLALGSVGPTVIAMSADEPESRVHYKTYWMSTVEGWAAVALLLVGLSLLYAGGMVLNDVVDASRDRDLAPGRPIPSGRVTRRAAGWAAAGTLGGGWLGVALAGWFAAAVAPGPGAGWWVAGGWGLCLGLCIVLYDLLHAANPAACVLMGLCRGLIYVVGAAVGAGLVLGEPWPWEAAVQPQTLLLATGLAGYVTAVTLLARREHGEAGRAQAGERWVPRVLLFSPLLALLIAVPLNFIGWGVAGLMLLLIAGGWKGAATVQRPGTPPGDKKVAILMMLALLCSLDFVFLLLLDSILLAVTANLLFLVTWLGHRRISGT